MKPPTKRSPGEVEFIDARVEALPGDNFRLIEMLGTDHEP